MWQARGGRNASDNDSKLFFLEGTKKGNEVDACEPYEP